MAAAAVEAPTLHNFQPSMADSDSMSASASMQRAHTPRAQQDPPQALPPDLVAAAFSPPSSSSSSTADSTPAASSPLATTIIPSYPYNTSLAPFLSPSVGLNGAPHATPDDSDVTTRLPSVQVDYLSHEWSEEDVWTSWRATTKHKASIVNGVRLENASWRTWNKQRNKLKTISPETLNWFAGS